MAVHEAIKEIKGQKSSCIAFGNHPSDAKLSRFVRYDGRSNEETSLADVKRRHGSCIARCKGKYTRVILCSLMFEGTTCSNGCIYFNRFCICHRRSGILVSHRTRLAQWHHQNGGCNEGKSLLRQCHSVSGGSCCRWWRNNDELGI